MFFLPFAFTYLLVGADLDVRTDLGDEPDSPPYGTFSNVEHCDMREKGYCSGGRSYAYDVGRAATAKVLMWGARPTPAGAWSAGVSTTVHGSCVQLHVRYTLS